MNIQNQLLDPMYLAYAEMKSKGFTEKKMGSYLYNIKRFLFSTEKPLNEITQEDINNYLQKMLSRSQLNYLVMNSLKFFFKDILKNNIDSNS